MGLRLRIALLLPLVALLGCGSSTASNPPASAPTLSGNWQINLPTPYTGVPSEMAGSLQFSGGAVNGAFTTTIHDGPPGCSLQYNSPVVGTLDGSGGLVLSLPIGGGAATVTTTIGPDPETPANANYQVVGGACATTAEPVTITQYAPLTGTFTGTYNAVSGGTAIPGETITITAVLTQSAAPTAVGQFPLSGTVTVTGACSASFAFTGGYVLGAFVESNPAPNTPGFFEGTIGHPSADWLAGLATFSACPNYIFDGGLYKQ